MFSCFKSIRLKSLKKSHQNGSAENSANEDENDLSGNQRAENGEQNNVVIDESPTETSNRETKKKKGVMYIQAEWSALALVINRLLLIVFFLIMIILNAVFFGTPYNQFHLQ